MNQGIHWKAVKRCLLMPIRETQVNYQASSIFISVLILSLHSSHSLITTYLQSQVDVTVSRFKKKRAY